MVSATQIQRLILIRKWLGPFAALVPDWLRENEIHTWPWEQD